MIGVALLGTGWAARIHARALRRHRDEVTLSVASRDPARAAEAGRALGAARHHASYEAALGDPQVHAVVVVTPPSTHAALVRQALAAGKHVIVEKPAFGSVADLDDAVALAERRGVRLLVAENYPYKPLATTLRDVIASGDLGDLRLIAINALRRQRSGGWRDDAGAAEGGALFESGIHWLSLMTTLGPHAHSARAFRAGGAGAGLDRTTHLVLEYDEGVVGTLSHSWEIAAPFGGLRLSRLFGTAGSVTFESNGLLVVVRGRRSRVRIPDPRDLLGYRAMWRALLGAIARDEPVRYDLAAARLDLSLLEAVGATPAFGREQAATRPPGAVPLERGLAGGASASQGIRV